MISPDTAELALIESGLNLCLSPHPFPQSPDISVLRPGGEL